MKSEQAVDSAAARAQMAEREDEVRTRILKAQKISFRNQYEHGLISPTAATYLSDLVDYVGYKKRFLEVRCIIFCFSFSFSFSLLLFPFFSFLFLSSSLFFSSPLFSFFFFSFFLFLSSLLFFFFFSLFLFFFFLTFVCFVIFCYFLILLAKTKMIASHNIQRCLCISLGFPPCYRSIYDNSPVDPFFHKKKK